MEVCDQLRSGVLSDRSQFFNDLTLPFYGFNRPGAKASEGLRQSFWLQGMMPGFPAAYFCIKASSETDLTEDLRKFDVPTLILHGDDDQIVPIAASALAAAKLIKGASFKVYSGLPHGLCSTHKEQAMSTCWPSSRAEDRERARRPMTWELGCASAPLGR
jgi:non-heme chloroperoxidase